MSDDQPRDENVWFGDVRTPEQRAEDREANATPAPCCGGKPIRLGTSTASCTCLDPNLLMVASTESTVLWVMREA